jgi:hypothetical protein
VCRTLCVAILNLHCGHAWKLWGDEVLRQIFGLPELTLLGRQCLEREFAKSAARSVDRRDAQHQKKADQIRRERKQGSVKAVANGLRRGVVHYKSRRGASSDWGDDHELIVVSDSPSDDGDIPDTRKAPMTRGQRPIIPKRRLACLLAAGIRRVNLDIDVDPQGIGGIVPIVKPGCWCHVLALLSAPLSIGCVSSAIMEVAGPAELVHAIQLVIAWERSRTRFRT